MFKKIVQPVIILCLFVQFFAVDRVFAGDDFSDVTVFYPNYPAIQYLKDENVVSGFSDGTFGPDKNITRCEFLKILMRASKIEVFETTEKSFPDIDTNFWCNQYTAKAKELGIVKGDEFGFFWPQKNISRIEALKILYLARAVNLEAEEKSSSDFFDVPVDSWYFPYVSKASYSNIISEKKVGVFGANEALLRSEMAEMIYRLLALEANTQNVYEKGLKPPIGFLDLDEEKYSEEILEAPLITFESDLSPINSPLSKKYFDKIELDNNLPRTFVKHEIYTVAGKILNSVETKVTIFLNNKKGGKQYTFIGEVDKNGRFEIQMNLKIDGTFSIGILPGLSGVSNVSDIVVLPEKNSSNSIDLVSDNLKIEIDDRGDAVFKWENYGMDLSKIVIRQKAKEIVKIVSTGTNYYIPDYVEYKSFSEDDTYFAVFLADSDNGSAYSRNTAWSKASATFKFMAVKHNYSVKEQDKLKLNNIPFSAKTGSKFKIEGESLSDLRPEIALIQPNGLVKEVVINTEKKLTKDSDLGIDIIPAPFNFNSTISFPNEGTYFIEINYKNGLAGFNSPVYVGGVIPLLPDFRDLDNEIPAITKAEVENNIVGLRTKLLALINADRVKYGLSKVKLNEKLNEFAQAHSDDMAKNNYFGHLNLKNEGPGIRKQAFSIETPVGENLAKSRNLISIHEGLMRSAIHRDNLLRSDWEEVGLGLSIDKEGYLIAVEEFSTSPLEKADLSQIKTDLYDYLREKRANLNLDELIVNKLGETICEDWSEKMASQNFFDFTVPDSTESLQKNVQNKGFNASFSTLILSGGDLNTLKQGLDKSKNIYSNVDWTQVSIGLALSENGMEIRATMIFFAN